MKNNIVVLAYSGGLDTSYCVKYLKHEQGLEVHAVLVNTGGFDDEEIEIIKNKAVELGVSQFKSIDVTEQFYTDAVRFLIFGNILKNDTYPLSVSAERIFQAIAIAKYASEANAAYIAHGSTGAGNDQVRFDLAFNVICPDAEIITPIRDQQLSRATEIEYLQSHGVEMNWDKAKYSVNKGLWGTSVGGVETLTSHQTLPEEAYPSQVSKEGTETIKLSFEAGEIVAINGQKHSSVACIQQLEKLANAYAIGRDMHVGDTIIGIKGRVGFEAAAPMVIIKAHHTLEKHVLTKWQQYWKEQLAEWYGIMMHEGQYLDPVMRNIEEFLLDTQKHVSGEVEVQLHPYRFVVVGITSDYDLMNSKFGDYGEMNNAWSGEDVKGFTKILANPTKIHSAIHNLKDKL